MCFSLFLSLYLEFLLVKCSKIFTAHHILYNTNFIHKKIGFVKAVSLIFAAAAAAKKVLLISRKTSSDLCKIFTTSLPNFEGGNKKPENSLSVLLFVLMLMSLNIEVHRCFSLNKCR